MNERIISILETIPKNILINCAEKIIFGDQEKEDNLDQELKNLSKSLTDPYLEDIESVMKRIKEIKKFKSGPSCISRSKVGLRDYQIKAIQFINNPNNNSLLIVHGTGTGKTLTALTASQCFLDANPDGRILVISPASLLKNFEKEMPKYGGSLSSKYTFYSFTKFTSLNHGAFATAFDIFYREKIDEYQDQYPDKDSDEVRHIMFKYFNTKIKKPKVIGPDSAARGMKIVEEDPRYTRYKREAEDINLTSQFDCKGAMVIIDEAHHLRSMKVQYKAMFDSVIKAKKILLLTATPFVNTLHDFVPLINILYRDAKILSKLNKSVPTGRTDIEDPKYYKTLDNIANVLTGKVTFYNEKSSDLFPTVRMHKIEINMTMDFFKRYEAELKAGSFGDIPELYYNGFRRAVNAIGVEEYLNQKIDDVLKILRNGHQSLVFTNWLEDGVEILKKVFDKNDVSYLLISGEVLPNERLGIVESFNNKRVQTLIITMAGSEGLDLRETRNVIILDPVWNKATIDQVIGRAVRYNSHIKLRPDQRYVDVYSMVLISPYKSVPSGDELLYAIINRKTEILNDVEKMLKEISI